MAATPSGLMWKDADKCEDELHKKHKIKMHHYPILEKDLKHCGGTNITHGILFIDTHKQLCALNMALGRKCIEGE